MDDHASDGGIGRRAGPDDDRSGRRTDPSGSRGFSRRRLLATSAAAVGTTAVGAGCLGGDGESGPTVYVFNTGDMTVSLIDPGEREVRETVEFGAASSFPSNQFTPRLADAGDEPLWFNVDGGVEAVEVGTLESIGGHETGAGANWQERTPDGAHLIVSAREPTHANYRLDADPDSETFGEVTGEIDRSIKDGIGDRDGPGPCDVTIHPGGEYAYVPDIWGNALTVLSVDPFEVRSRIEVDPATDADHAGPWMGTASWDGEWLLIENDEGTESVWDASDPAVPEETARLTDGDGLGSEPLTSEIGPESEVGYVFTPGTGDATVIDVPGGRVLDRLDLGGEAYTGTWDPDRERLYVPVQTRDEVAVIDHEDREVTGWIAVGEAPYGATASVSGPDPDALEARPLASPNGADGRPTYCVGNCRCSPGG